MYKAILRRVLATIYLKLKSNNCYVFWECVCNLMYPVCNAHAPYFRLWSGRLYIIFPHYIVNGTISEKRTLLKMKCVVWFSPQICLKHLFILWRSERDMITNVHWSHCKVNFIVDRFFFKKIQILYFTKIRLVGTELFRADWRRDGQREGQNYGLKDTETDRETWRS